MKKIRRLITIALSLSVLLILSTSIAMAVTIKTPEDGQTVPVGSTVQVSVETEGFEEGYNNVCVFEVYDNAENLVFNDNVLYEKEGQTVAVTFNAKKKGKYTILASCGYVKNGSVLSNSSEIHFTTLNSKICLFDEMITINANGKLKTKKPAKISLTSLKAGNDAFTAKWKKTNCDGYQIRYSSYSKMLFADEITVSGKKTVSKTVKKLDDRTKYYVQIRTYKNIGKGVMVCSAWSKTKSVKTK